MKRRHGRLTIATHRLFAGKRVAALGSRAQATYEWRQTIAHGEAIGPQAGSAAVAIRKVMNAQPFGMRPSADLDYRRKSAAALGCLMSEIAACIAPHQSFHKDGMCARTAVTKRGPVPPALAPLVAEVRSLIQSARHAAASTVNTPQVLTNFEIGRRVVEHEQMGAKRAAYGTELLKALPARLTEEFGKGFSKPNLEYMRRFLLECGEEQA